MDKCVEAKNGKSFVNVFNYIKQNYRVKCKLDCNETAEVLESSTVL
jgi:hypothetical protein